MTVAILAQTEDMSIEGIIALRDKSYGVILEVGQEFDPEIRDIVKAHLTIGVCKAHLVGNGEPPAPF